MRKLLAFALAAFSISAAAPPAAPANLVASVNGSTVTLTWAAPTIGDPPASYIIEAGSGPGLANLASFATGSVATSFQATGVVPGTYFVRVRAANSSGTSEPSNEVVISVGGGPCSPPGAPSGLTIAANSGGIVTFVWTAASGAPTSYIIEAGSAPGLSNLAAIDLGNAVTRITVPGVPSGRYYVRVRAKNACGVSAPSNEVALVVGGAPPPGVETAEQITQRCPTAAEVAAIDADVILRFDADPTAGTIVCSANVSGRNLTLLQMNAYLSLIIMQRLTFTTPLPWTAESLYPWFIHSVRGLRFRSDIQFSSCCDEARLINIPNGVAIAHPELPRLPLWLFGFIELVTHEARHANGFPHTCGNNDQTVQELGAWGVQYLLAHWIVTYSDPLFISNAIREEQQRARDNLCSQFCQSCRWP